LVLVRKGGVGARGWGADERAGAGVDGSGVGGGRLAVAVQSRSLPRVILGPRLPGCW